MQKGDLLLVRKGQMHNIISAEIEPLRFFLSALILWSRS